MFNKETFRLIKKTFNRFISILLIVLIGVSFMMGLLVTSTTMRTSMDVYADETNLHDIQLYSSYGFDQEDISKLEELDNLDSIFASKFFDCYCLNERNKYICVTRVEEIDRSIDKFELLEGSLPTNDNEVVILNNALTESAYTIGDEITIYYDEDDITTKIKQVNFKIVGIVRSTAYTSKVLGSSTYKNMDLNLVIYANNELFIQDYYTTVYLKYSNTIDLLSFTDEYDEVMENNIDELEYVVLNQQNNLKKKIIEQANQEIEENEKLLNELKTTTQAELDKAKQQLDDARTRILVLETAIETINTPVSNEIASISKEKDTQIDILLDNQKRINKLNKQYNTTYNKLCIEVSAYNTVYEFVKGVQNNTDKIVELKNNNLEKIEEYENIISTNTPLIEKYQKRLDNTDSSNPLYLLLYDEINQLTLENSEVESNIELYNNINNVIDIVLNDEESKENIINYIDSKYPNITDLNNEINEINSTTIKTETQLTKLNTELETINVVDSYILKFKNEISDIQQQYIDGMNEYNQAVDAFNTEIEKANKQINDAKEQLNELPKAKWTILDRDLHYSSSLFKNNADQMQAIGIAIPLLFYIVAALVCLTTMIRLVDEQRGQIGIYLALGFSKKQIIFKYAFYAFLACFIGSILGISVGPISFPVVIYNTWKLMYVFPDIKIVYPIWAIVICFVAFTFLVVFETVLIVNNSLTESPASLLRPKAPKNAKKIFLEKIPFIWNKIKFITKITLRNLFRYKARFFMTIIGIAGCTSLLVVGWGIKDSISDIIDIQYGDIFNYDYNINLENEQNIDEIEAILNKYKETTYSKYMTYTSNISINSVDKNIYVQVVNNKSMDALLNIYDYKTHENLYIKNNGIIISQKFAIDNNIKVGDTIYLESLNGNSEAVKVNAICEMYFQHYIFMSENYYEQTFGEEISYNAIALDSNQIENINNQLKEFDNIESISDFDSMISQFNIMLEALDLIILVIIVTAGSLAFVVLMNLIQVNISERTREIATLKVLGFNNKEINNYIFKEIYILTIIGALIGLPLGIIEHHFIMNVISMEMVTFGSNIYLPSFIYAFGLTIIFTFIVLQFTKKTLKKIQMIESLKSVE